MAREDSRWLQFADASERLATARSLSAVVDILRETAREIVGAQGISVILRDDDTCFYVAEDAIGPLWTGGRFPLQSCISGWAMTRRETVLISDIRLDPRVPQEAYAPTFVRSMAMAPIGHPEPVAALGAYWADVRDHDPGEVRRLEALARAAAIALQNARLLGDLQQSERDRTIALEAGRMGVWTLDLAGHALETTPMFRKIFGHDPAQDFTFAMLREALHPDDRSRVFAAIDACIADHADCDLEHRILTPGGQVRWVGMRAKPAYHADGRARALSGVTADITERVQMEQERESFAAVLEQRVAQRTQELMSAQEALRHSRKLEAMGQLTGGVAHDFNNLLTPILGSLDMLVRRNLGDPRERRLIAGALQSAERARTLVQRLLAFARRQPLKARAVDVAMLLLELTPLLEITLGTQVDLALDIAPDTPLAHADPDQLGTALVNVAVNARDAMPGGGRLAIAAMAGADDHVVIHMQDTGMGMDAATLERAVEPFFSTKGVGKGTGLGLSMVHGLMAQLGGDLRIGSVPGEGTTVELWLPVSHEALPDAASQKAQPVFSARKTVLLVDDEALVRASTADMLAEFGLTVIEAQSGSEALEVLARGDAIDLVVTDHMMPAMTGAELVEAVKARRPGLPLLLVSGYADLASIPVDVARLEKPFRQRDLAISIAGVLGAG